MAATSAPTRASNIVLVYGLFADGSCGSEVIARLQAAETECNGRAKPADDAARSGRFCPKGAGATGRADGSGRTFFSGMIATEAEAAGQQA
jgi:hypothetical protein